MNPPASRKASRCVLDPLFCRYGPSVSQVHFVGVLLLGGLVGSGGTESEPPSTPSEVKTQTPITRIAFGSCNDQAAPQPL
ncbi:hypothetical protein GGP50_003207 [Salinibacter ruber]|nr:hypothetical protein [Salinibacter ruber]MCS3668816.1 hypothetical protein [Salinibacter ruber]MCS3827342.1 hypothetical protein [Salinibacter ruber]MCS4144634.1 hypothetical protein [Salinibacter ruber]MCS4194970.1 hypothetical protein [Salinibacter ruber]